MSDNKVTSFTANDRTILGIGAVQADRTFIDTIKTYPINMEIQTLRTYAMTSGRTPAAKTGAATLALNTSVVLLPREPMQPRFSDERVGYFNNKITEFSDDQQTTTHEAIIMRYRLEPKDVAVYKSGRLVEPKKPIVFYIDPATPKKWVKYLKQGIDDWQKAFEAAGFKNAIMAKEWPTNDSTMSLDDARYSVLRYLPSETENAYGPRIVDPRSGEIIEAHVCWYHNVINLVKKWYMVQCGPLDKRAQKMEFPDELMGQLIRFVSSHEVGHALGLRHNMIASQATPVEKLRDKAWVEKHGHTASIMDYARFNYVAQPEDHIGEEDLDDNQMQANEYGIMNLKRVMQHLEQWTAQPDGQYDDLNTMHRAVRAQYQRYTNHVQKYLFGKYINNAPGQKPHDIVPRTLHREALQWLDRNVMEAPLWLYPESMISKLGLDYMDEIRARQQTIIAMLLSANAVANMINESLASPLTSQLKSLNPQPSTLNPQPYPVDEYFDDIFAMVWKPLTDSDERQNSLRRLQQRAYVDFIGMVFNPSKEKSTTAATTTESPVMVTAAMRSDAILYFEQHLDKVEEYLKGMETETGTLNALHYKDLLKRINKIREGNSAISGINQR